MQHQSLNEQLWPNYQRCFGCGAENELGLQLNLYERAGAVISRWEPRPEYANFWGTVHGGVLTVALDELAGTAAWLGFRRRGDQQPVVTAEFTVRFRAAARIGQPLDCSARAIELGDRHALVEAKLEAQGSEVAALIGRYVLKPNEDGGGAVAVTTAERLP